MCVKCTGRRRASRDAERSDRRLDGRRAPPRPRAAPGAGCARAGFFMIHRTRCITYTLLYYPLTYSSPHTLLCVPGRVGSAHSRVETRHSHVTLETHTDHRHRSLFTRADTPPTFCSNLLSFVGALPPPPSIQLLTSRRDLSSTLSAHTNTSAWSTRGQGRGAHICHDTCHRITHAGRVVVSRHHTA